MLEQTPDILTFQECQELLKVGKNTLLDLLHNNDIEAFKIGFSHNYHGLETRLI